MLENHFLHDRQPQARALGPARVVGVENAIPVLLGDAWTVVSNLDEAGGLRCVGANEDAAATRWVRLVDRLNRIPQDVVDTALEHHGVHTHADGFRCTTHMYFDGSRSAAAHVLEDRRNRIFYALNEIAEVGRREICARELGKSAELADEPPQGGDLFLDDRPCVLELLPIGLVFTVVGLAHLLGGKLDRGERVLDLVRQASREVLPGADALQVFDASTGIAQVANHIVERLRELRDLVGRARRQGHGQVPRADLPRRVRQRGYPARHAAGDDRTDQERDDDHEKYHDAEHPNVDVRHRGALPLQPRVHFRRRPCFLQAFEVDLRNRYLHGDQKLHSSGLNVPVTSRGPHGCAGRIGLARYTRDVLTFAVGDANAVHELVSLQQLLQHALEARRVAALRHLGLDRPAHGVRDLLGPRPKRHELSAASLHAMDQLCAEPFVHADAVDLTQGALGEKNAPSEGEKHRQADRE